MPDHDRSNAFGQIGTSAISRRMFVQGTGAVLAGGALSSLSFAQPRMQDAETLKIGLIGCGGRGTGAAVQALSADPNNVLTAMGDVFAERIESSHKNMTDHFGESASQKLRVDQAHRYVGFDAYQKVINSGVDVVILTTPPGFRPQQLKAAIEAGKHVFCEKPVAVDAPGIQVVLDAAKLAKEKQLALMCGFCWRYSAAERAAFKQVNSGACGDIISVHSTYHTSTLGKRPRQAEWSEMEFQLRNWWHFTWLSGDHLVEQACHSVDRMSWAMGDKTPVQCTALGGCAARTGEESGNVFDHFTVIYEYADGKRSFLTCRQIDNTPFDNEDYIYGTTGSCQIDGWKPLHVVKDYAGKTTWQYDGPYNDMYQNEHNELFAAIREGKPMNDGPWMAHSTMMALMGRMAAYTGQTVTWDQAMRSKEDLTPKTMAFGPVEMRPLPVPGKTQFV